MTDQKLHPKAERALWSLVREINKTYGSGFGRRSGTYIDNDVYVMIAAWVLTQKPMRQRNKR